MSEETKVEETTEEAPKKGRPAARQSRAERRKRSSVHGSRDILKVTGLDPAFQYRWVKDRAAEGARIQRMEMLGWELVDNSDGSLMVGQTKVGRVTENGSLVAIPDSTAKDGSVEYLYLMKIPKELFEEDKAEEQKEINEREKQLSRSRKGSQSEDGQYGTISVSHGRKPNSDY